MMLILFQMIIPKKSQESKAGKIDLTKLNDKEFEVVVKLLDQLSVAGITQDKIEKIINDKKDEKISAYIVLTGAEAVILKGALAKFGIKIEINENVEQEILDKWAAINADPKYKDDKDDSRKIYDFVEWANMLGVKETKIQKAPEEKKNEQPRKVKGDKLDIKYLTFNAEQIYNINQEINNITNQIKKEKESYNVKTSTVTPINPGKTAAETGETPKQPPATEQQQPKTDNQTQQEPTFTEPIKIDNIDFNNPKYGYKVDKLIKGEIVEYEANLDTKDETGKKRADKLIEEINKLTGKKYGYVKDYPKDVSTKDKKIYKVKIEEKKDKEQKTTKKGEASNNQNLQTNTQVQNNDMMEEIKKNEDYKWLVKNIFTIGKEVSPKITNLAQKIANGEEKITMESFKSGQKVNDVEDYFKKLAAAFGYEVNEFKYKPAEKKGSHSFNITLTKAKSQANEVKPTTI